MDLNKLRNETENASVSFKKSTLKRIKIFMKENKIKKFSPTIDGIIIDWLDKQKENKNE